MLLNSSMVSSLRAPQLANLQDIAVDTSDLSKIREKILKQGILALKEPELQVLETKTKSGAWALDKVKDCEQLHKKNVERTAKIKKIVAIIAVIAVSAAAIFALAYFAAPAIALAAAAHVAAATTAGTTLAAGTCIKLALAHAGLAAGYVALPLAGLLTFLVQHVKEQQKKEADNKKVEKIWQRLSPTT